MLWLIHYFKREASVYPSSIPSLSEELNRETKQFSKSSLVCMGTSNYCASQIQTSHNNFSTRVDRLMFRDIVSLPTTSDPNSMLTLGSLALASFPDSQASVVSGNRSSQVQIHT